MDTNDHLIGQGTTNRRLSSNRKMPRNKMTLHLHFFVKIFVYFTYICTLLLTDLHGYVRGLLSVQVWKVEWCKIQGIKIASNINNQPAVQHFFFLDQQ